MKNPANLAQDPLQRLALMCKDIDQWPKSWAGDGNDVIAGNESDLRQYDATCRQLYKFLVNSNI